MQLSFFKYQGTGNDFVILDNRKDVYHLTKKEIRMLCDRRFGVGGDGLMLLNSHTDYHFEMKYYNANGAESSMCGNGGRCLVKFAQELGMAQSTYRFLAIDGEHEAIINHAGNVSLKMNDVDKIEHHLGYSILNTGSPHYVLMTTDLMHMDICKKGREIRYSQEFAKEGINVNFVEQTFEPDKITVRTYERGVEDETLSCGTGVTAAALVFYHNENGFNNVEVRTKGGELCVEFEKTGTAFKNIWLTGPAKKVFEGTIELKE